MKECLACNKCYDDSFTHCQTDGKVLEFTLKSGILLDNKYVFNKRLGEGGMGTVYEATQIMLQRSVAIKVLSPNFTSQANSRERFEREALAIAKLKHPNIVSIHDFGFSKDGYAYLVMEFISGFQLKRFMERWPICGLEFGVDIARQIAEALSMAHTFGVLHRDIKPENIMFEGLLGDSIMKVVDFGLVKIKGDDGQQRRLTAPNMLVGTFNYMSPEVCLGEEIDERSDIYSLGVLLYELFTGSLPCSGDDPLEIVEAHIKKIPLSPSRFINEIPTKLENLILSSLDKKPNNRPQSAKEMAKELSEILIDIARRNINKYTPATAKAELLAAQNKISTDSMLNADLHELEKVQTALLKNPNDISQQEKVAELNQKAGLILESIEAFFNAADLSYQLNKFDSAIAYYLKIYNLISTDQRVSVARKLIDIYCQQEQFDLAYRYAEWLMRYYCSKELFQEAQKIVELIPKQNQSLEDPQSKLIRLLDENLPISSTESRRSWRRRRPQPKMDLSSQVVFIATPNSEDLKQITQAISKLNCQIKIADTAEHIFELVKLQWPSMLIFDMDLPDFSGSDLYWRLQETPLMRETTYVCISTNKKDVEIDAAFNEGIDDYWVKPIEIEHLSTRVRRLLLHNKNYTQIVENLARKSILEILQQLETSRRTGVLTIKSSSEQATILLIDGIIVNARLNQLPPLGALYRLVFWNEGVAYFRPDVPTKERVMEIPCYLLMQHVLNFYDEEKNIIGSFPATNTFLKLQLPEMIIAEQHEQEVVKLFDGTRPLREIFEHLRGDFMRMTIALSLYRSSNPNLFVNHAGNIESTSTESTESAESARKTKNTSHILTRPLN